MNNLLRQLVTAKAVHTQQDTAARVWIPQPDDYSQLAAQIEQAVKRQAAHEAWCEKYGFDTQGAQS